MKRTSGKQSEGLIRELRNAGLLQIGLFAIILVAAYAALLIYGLLFGQWFASDKAGQFGDAFGALTALLNALAFAAVVTTVVLQSRELRESRDEMRRLEATRIRPVIKAEWSRFKDKSNHYQYVVRNVGLGVAIVTAIELYPSADGSSFIRDNGAPESGDTWMRALDAALGKEHHLDSFNLLQFDDLNRALAPNEPQAIIRLIVTSERPDRAFGNVRKFFRPVIHFRSVNGEEYTSANQFDAVPGVAETDR